MCYTLDHTTAELKENLCHNNYALFLISLFQAFRKLNMEYTQLFHLKLYRVNSPNTGCLLNIGNGPKAAHHCIVRPRATKWSIDL